MEVAYLLADSDGRKVVVFMCPGCKSHHPVTVQVGTGDPLRPCWTWNESLTAPTFSPSLLCHPTGNGGNQLMTPRCHSFIHEGRIEFLSDCQHELAGQTVALGPHEWD